MKSKICDSVCKRKYNFVLKGAGISTEISNKKYKILLDRVDVITAYQVYNEYNQKQNKERCVIDLAPIDFVNIFKKNCKFTPTIVLEDISFSPFYIGKITCACITKDEQLCLIVDCNGFKSKSRFNDEMPVGELKNVRIQIDSTSVSSITPPKSGTFIFNLDTSDWDGTIPLINNNKSFTYTTTTSVGGNTIYVSIAFSYTTASENDGLSFSNVGYADSTSLTISQFGGIPLSRGGCQFFNTNLDVGFNGKITATDVPTILPGTSLYKCFSQAGNNIGSYNSLFTIQGIENWNMSNVVNMNEMFYNAFYFNHDISKWDTSKVTDMNTMFWNVYYFKSDIGNWDTSKVTDMSYMFHYCNQNFNQDIGGWNTSNVTNMKSMFFYAEVFNRDIGNWDTSKVTNMDNMFLNARHFNQDLSRWCVENIKSEPASFAMDAFKFEQDNMPKWGTCPSNN